MRRNKLVDARSIRLLDNLTPSIKWHPYVQQLIQLKREKLKETQIFAIDNIAYLETELEIIYWLLQKDEV